MAYPCKDASKGASQGCSAEEEGNTIMLLLALVPHRKVEDNARKKATLSHAKEESRYEEASHVLGHSEKRRDDTPGEC